jgi:hypothetical protein
MMIYNKKYKIGLRNTESYAEFKTARKSFKKSKPKKFWRPFIPSKINFEAKKGKYLIKNFNSVFSVRYF